MKKNKKTKDYLYADIERKKERILDIVNKSKNHKKILEVRKKLGIPKDGVPIGYGYKLAHLSEYGAPPNMSTDLKKASELSYEICREESIGDPDIEDYVSVINYYIAFGRIEPFHLEGKGDIVLQVVEKNNNLDSHDSLSGKKIYAKKFYGRNIFMPLNENIINQNYPLSIHFKPSTRQRDLFAFIKALWHQREKYIEDNKLDIKRIRRKPNREINDLIYNLRDKSPDEIKNKLTEKFGEKIAGKYHYIEIKNIINREKKRRDVS